MDEQETDRLLANLLERAGLKPAAGSTCPEPERIALLAEESTASVAPERSGKLLPAERRALEAHVRECARCRGALDAFGLPETPLARDVGRRRFRVAIAAVTVVAAALFIAALVIPGWRAGSTGDLPVNWPALVLARRGDVRTSGGQPVSPGSEVAPGAVLRLERGAEVALLAAREILLARREDASLEVTNARVEIDWEGMAERDRRLSDIRERVLRSPPGVTAAPLRLVTPLGAIADPRPTFRWDGSAESVRVRLSGHTELWESAEVSGHEIPYPEELPPLEPGRTYVWFVEGPTDSRSASIRLRGDAEARRIEADVSRVRRLVRRDGSRQGPSADGTSPDTECTSAFLAVRMFRQAGFFDRADSEAIQALERHPRCRLLLEEWALLREETGDPEGARDLARKAKEIED